MRGVEEPKIEADRLSQPSSRRDVRHRIAEGGSVTCTVPLVASGTKEATLTILSVSGLAFEVEGEPRFTPGTSLGGMTVRAGVCSIRGDAMVRSVKPLGAARFEIGCLFVPDSAAAEDRWMALISGVEVASGLRGE